MLQVTRKRGYSDYLACRVSKPYIFTFLLDLLQGTRKQIFFSQDLDIDNCFEIWAENLSSLVFA